jgi:hypothetical protein
VLELREAALDEVSERINAAIDRWLDFTVPAARNDSFHTSFCEIVTDGVTVIALVSDQHLGFGAWLFHQRFIAFEVGSLSTRERHRDGKADAVGSQMDLGRLATARAPNILVSNPLFAPAAC